MGTSLAWADIDNDGLDGREQAIEYRRSGGILLCQYSGALILPEDVDVDHILCRDRAKAIAKNGREAWRSFCNWQGNLALTSKNLNRSKGAKGPDKWFPALPEARIWFARRWLDAAHRFNLTPTDAELAALERLQAGEAPAPRS